MAALQWVHMLPLLFLLISLGVAALLLLFLRTGAARAFTVWLLAATLPLLAALSAALAGQAHAKRVLDAAPATYTVYLRTAGQSYTLKLSAPAAACLHKSVRLHTGGHLHTPQGDLPLNDQTEVSGDWPAPATEQALDLRGLACRPFIR